MPSGKRLERPFSFNLLPAFYQTRWFATLCTLAFCGLAWFAYNLRIRQVAARLDKRFDERLAERTRIAQDLHDTLLQGFFSALMQLHVADDEIAPDSSAKPLVSRVLQLMRQVIDEGRNALQGLRLSHLACDDLAQALFRIPQELAIACEAEFHVTIEGHAQPLRPIIRDDVYRIVREAVANALRHSKAAHINVELDFGPDRLKVTIQGRWVWYSSRHFARRAPRPLGSKRHARTRGKDSGKVQNSEQRIRGHRSGTHSTQFDFASTDPNGAVT